MAELRRGLGRAWAPACAALTWVSLAGAFLASAPAAAQPATLPHARLWAVTPCGAKAGTTTRVTVAGADLEDVRELRFSRPGVAAAPAPDPSKPGAFLPGQFDVTIAPNAASGLCDVRAVGRYGVSNPRVFAIGSLPEIQEKEPNDDLPQAQPLPLDCVVNGAISSPADVDYFKIEGKAGQTVVAACAAESVDSKLDPELRAYSAAGKRLGQSWRRAGREALLAIEMPGDGVCIVRLCQHAHQSGDAFHFYRLTVTAKPWALAAAPLAEPGRAEAVGFNLDAGAAEPSFGEPLRRSVSPVEGPRSCLGPRAARLFGLPLAEWRPGGAANAVPLRAPEQPLFRALSPSGPEHALPIAPPGTIAGQLRGLGQMDWFRFDAKAGQIWIAEGFADRLGSALDLFFELRHADGRLLGEFDEHSEPLTHPRFWARTDDPKARLTFPSDGAYLLGVGARGKPGSPGVYSVSLRPELPDFRLVAADMHPQSPGAWQLARGSCRPIEIHVQRRDGFAGAVRLRLANPPPGATAEPQFIPPSAAALPFVVHVAPDAPSFVGALKIVGAAEINGKLVEHEAEAGCQVWPNPVEAGGVPAQSRLCDDIMACVRETPPLALEIGQESAVAAVGGIVPLRARLRRLTPEANVPVAIMPLAMPPGAVFNGNNQPVTLSPGVEIVDVAVALPANLPPGPRHLTLAAQAQVSFSKNPQDPKVPKQNVLVTEAARPVQLEIVAAPPETKLK